MENLIELRHLNHLGALKNETLVSLEIKPTDKFCFEQYLSSNTLNISTGISSHIVQSNFLFSQFCIISCLR